MGPQQWMQKPILRLVGQGHAWVACFIILSGFVNSLKAIKLVRQGNIDGALNNLAISSFRRSFRLFLPATAATILSWFICQFGAYETARQSDAYWLYITSPQPSYSWGTAIEDLIRAVRNTWLFNPENVYDQPQWALLYLLEGSMVCFMGVLATVNLTPRWRIATLTLCWFWSWNWGIRIGDRTYLHSHPWHTLTISSNGLSRHLHGYHARRAPTLRYTPRPLTIRPLLRPSHGPHRPGPNVLPLRIPHLGPLVQVPPRMVPKSCPHKRRTQPLLAHNRRPALNPYCHPLPPPPPRSQPQIPPLARKNQLPDLPPPWLLHAQPPLLAALRAVKTRRNGRTKRRSNVHCDAIPPTRLPNLLHRRAHLLRRLVHGCALLGE